MTQGHDREPLGQPAGDPADTSTIDTADLAEEHDATAVDERVASGADEDEREPESPEGLGGLEP
jgi:hypothetical protein